MDYLVPFNQLIFVLLRLLPIPFESFYFLFLNTKMIFVFFT